LKVPGQFSKVIWRRNLIWIFHPAQGETNWRSNSD